MEEREIFYRFLQEQVVQSPLQSVLVTAFSLQEDVGTEPVEQSKSYIGS